MVMVWLEGGQGEVRGACPPPHPKFPYLDPPPPPTLPTAPPPPPSWGPSAHFYRGGSRVQKPGECRKKFYCRSPHTHHKKSHPPYAKTQEYRVVRAASTQISSQEKPSPGVLRAPT